MEVAAPLKQTGPGPPLPPLHLQRPHLLSAEPGRPPVCLDPNSPKPSGAYLNVCFGVSDLQNHYMHGEKKGILKHLVKIKTYETYLYLDITRGTLKSTEKLGRPKRDRGGVGGGGGKGERPRRGVM